MATTKKKTLPDTLASPVLPPTSAQDTASGISRQTPDMAAISQLKPIVSKQVVVQDDVKKFLGTLQEYKRGKQVLEDRVVEEQEWYKLRHWQVVSAASGATTERETPVEPASGLLFSAIRAKHADAMDNYPECSVLPREMSDDPDAKMLSSIVPVVLERNKFDRTYSDNWWKKLKHGTAIYGEFWNPALENGLGDIDIKPIDILNIFWEPGITDIKKSRHVFTVGLKDIDIVEQENPELKGKIGNDTTILKQYQYDDTVDLTGKCLIVDMYSKVINGSGKTVVHLTKIVGDRLQYSSFNDPQYAERGFYDHGEYPFHFDVLFPEEGTPAGFGMIAILKDPQLYYDRLSAAVLENAILSTKPRFLMQDNGDVNETQLLDTTQAIVKVAGPVDDTHIKQIMISPVPSNTINVMEQKANELKETAANRDFNNGSSAAGVTAASAISALQESGNKTSRDEISASYRCYTDVVNMSIELMRQFYDEARYFRITGPNGNYEFAKYSNDKIKDQLTGIDITGAQTFRRPIFDITVKAQKKNPFSRASQNELALGLFKLNFFNPERAQEAMIALQIMEFEGKDKVLEQVMEGQTLLNICRNLAFQLDKLALVAQVETGVDMGIGTRAPGQKPSKGVTSAGSAAGPINAGQAAAQKPGTTSYQDKLAKRSVPDVNTQKGKVGMA